MNEQQDNYWMNNKTIIVLHGTYMYVNKRRQQMKM